VSGPLLLTPGEAKPTLGLKFPFLSTDACPWQVMQEELDTKPSSITEFPSRVGWPTVLANASSSRQNPPFSGLDSAKN
jgi:hypothetical protein